MPGEKTPEPPPDDQKKPEPPPVPPESVGITHVRARIAKWLYLFARVVQMESRALSPIAPHTEDAYKGFLEDAQRVCDTIAGRAFSPPAGADRLPGLPMKKPTETPPDDQIEEPSRQYRAEFEYRCRRCSKVFVALDQIVKDEKDLTPLRFLRRIITTEPGRPAMLAIHFCTHLSQCEVGVADLIGYAIRGRGERLTPRRKGEVNQRTE